MVTREVTTSNAPKATGAYSQGVMSGEWCFVSGQVGWDANRMGLESRSPGEQTMQALENIAQILASAGMSLRDVVKTTVYLADMSTFGEVNSAYEQAFRDAGAVFFPARTTIGANIRVAVEVDAIAQSKS